MDMTAAGGTALPGPNIMRNGGAPVTGAAIAPSSSSLVPGSTPGISASGVVDANLLNDLNKMSIQPTVGGQNSVAGSNGSPLDECLLCSDQKRDTVFKPCGHVVCCDNCGPRIKKCLICREAVSEREKIGECLVCSDRKAAVFFKPCGHMVACDNCAQIMKKCVQCRVQLEQKVPLSVCSGGLGNVVTVQYQRDEKKEVNQTVLQGINKSGHGVAMNNTMSPNVSGVSGTPTSLTTMNNIGAGNVAPNNLNLADDVQKLQQQLQDIKEQVSNFWLTVCFACRYWERTM